MPVATVSLPHVRKINSFHKFICVLRIFIRKLSWFSAIHKILLTLKYFRTMVLSKSSCYININTLIVHTLYTILHTDCIMTMTQYITLLYLLTSSLLSTSAPFDNNNSTTCKWPPSDALRKGVLPNYIQK